MKLIIILTLVFCGMLILVFISREMAACHGDCPHHHGCVERCMDANYCPSGEHE